MAAVSRLLNLPGELQDQVVDYLSFPDNVNLKNSCRHFHAAIPKLAHEQLLVAELTDLATEKDVYTCRYCLRLRSGPRFADTMLKAKKRRGGGEACKRFCVDCGIFPGPGITCYSRGDRITVRGEAFVICIRCNEFKTAPSQDKAAKDCLTCWTRSRQLQEARGRAAERARLRTEHDQRRARRRELFHADSEDDYSDVSDDEPIFGTPGWDAYHLALAQSDAFGDWASDF